MRRHLSCLLLCTLVTAAASCGNDGTTGVAVTLRDPQGLIDMVTPAKLRILAIPVPALSGTSYTCDAASGRLSPEPSTVDGAMIADAVNGADVTLDIHGGAADGMVSVPAGEYIIVVRGRGTDRVTMVPNTVIATACADQMIGAGATQTVNLTLVEVAGVGTCGDGIVSPDEQCDGGPLCSPSCETQPLVLDSTGGSQHPSVSWAPGGRAAAVFQSAPGGSLQLRIRLLDENGHTIMITGLGALAVDQALLASTIDRTAPTQDQPAVAAAGGRAAAAFLDVAGPNFDVSARFRDFNLTTPAAPDVETVVTEGPTAAATDTRTALSAMVQQNPTIAAMSDGTTLVVFENLASASGLSGRVYAAGATQPSGAMAFAVGLGSGGTQPAATVLGSQFVVAYATSSGIFVQKIAAAGTTTPPAMLAAATITPSSTTMTIPHQVAIAAMSPCPATGGCAIVAWHETGAAGDGDGSIRAQLLDSTGAPSGSAFSVNSTTTGDQTAPTAAAGNMRFVVGFQDAAGIHARNFDGTGTPALNRSRTPPPSTEDYLLAPGGSTFPAFAVGGTANGLIAVWQTSDSHIQSRTIPLP